MTETTATMKKDELELDTEESRLYELGFHLIPSLSGEDLSAAVATLKELITNKGGVLIREQVAEKKELAYAIQKDIDRKRYTYEDAYFGWMQFTAMPAAAHEIKETLENSDTVLRFLVVKITEEMTQTSEEKEEIRAEREDAASENEEVSEEEIDKEIDKLVEDQEDEE